MILKQNTRKRGRPWWDHHSQNLMLRWGWTIMDKPSKTQIMDWGGGVAGATVVLPQPWSTSHWIGWLPWMLPSLLVKRTERRKLVTQQFRSLYCLCTHPLANATVLVPMNPRTVWALLAPLFVEIRTFSDTWVRYIHSVLWHLLFGL
jgi:hypothetical protein